MVIRNAFKTKTISISVNNYCCDTYIVKQGDADVLDDAV